MADSVTSRLPYYVFCICMLTKIKIQKRNPNANKLGWAINNSVTTHRAQNPTFAHLQIFQKGGQEIRGYFVRNTESISLTNTFGLKVIPQ